MTVNGDGTYTTPKATSLSSCAPAGIYQWNATYSGDGEQQRRPATTTTRPSRSWVVTPCCNLQNVSFSVLDNGIVPRSYSDLEATHSRVTPSRRTSRCPAGITIRSRWSATSRRSRTSAPRRPISSRSTRCPRGFFAPGSHSLTVTVPSSYYQVDFVCGTAICSARVVPERLSTAPRAACMSADNGGTTVPSSHGQFRPSARARPRHPRSGTCSATARN